MDNATVEKNTNVTTKANQPKRDLYQEVTDKIMGLLEKGVAPWRQTWRTYNGINKILMNNTSHPIPYFLSFKQVKALNGMVKKGAKGEQVFFFKAFYKVITKRFRKKRRKH